LLPESKVQEEFGPPITVISGYGCHPDPTKMSLSTTWPVAAGTMFQARVNGIDDRPGKSSRECREQSLFLTKQLGDR
jgi:hypothetical protein